MVSWLHSTFRKGLEPEGTSGGAAEVTPSTPRDRAAEVLRRAESALRGLVPPPEDGIDRQDASALARRYLEAGRRQWELQHWGSAGLFGELALEWATCAGQAESEGSGGG